MAEIDKRESQGLEALAGEINAEHQAFVSSLKKTAEHGIRCGELLTKAKDRCPHGQWLEWLGANFEGSERTAQVYMQMYRNRDEIRAKTQSSADLSISGALKEIGGSAPRASTRPSSYDLAGRLQAAAAKGPGELAYEYGSLARDLSEKELRIVRGLAWERAWSDYKTNLERPDEGGYLLALRAISRHVRPADLLVGRQRWAYEEELEEWEMNATFEVLIEGGFICDYPASTGLLRALYRAHERGDKEMFEMLYEELAKIIYEGLGSVRPTPTEEEALETLD